MTPKAPLRPDTVRLDGPFRHQFLHTRGLRLHVATAGDPAAPLVLLIPDAFGGWYDYREVIAPLADAGFHVAAVDLRGYGLSDKPPHGPEFSARTLVSDVAGLIPVLGHDRAVVVGCDTGGALAWIMATTHPQRVAGLVSVSAAHPVDLRRAVAARPWNFVWMCLRHATFHLPAALLTRAPGRIAREIGRFLRLNTTGAFHRSSRGADELTLRLRAARIGNVAPAVVHTARTLLAPVPLRHLPLKVQCPTLLVHAPQSLWHHVYQRSARRVAEGVRVEATSIDGAKNLPHIESPRRFAAAVSAFLRADDAASSTDDTD